MQVSSPPAVISGGSSGIGLACARWLASRDIPVLLLARDETRLRSASAGLKRAFPRADVRTLALDVTDEEACNALARDMRAGAEFPAWLVTSAGQARPGRFLDLTSAQHRQQMEVNYFGTLNLVRAFTPLMTARGGGRIAMVSSGAALMGVTGYSAYGASKFAVRGLAEVLRIELASHGISVTIAYPPDTDTPQLEEEALNRPPETQAVAAGGGLATPDQVAHDIMSAAQAGRFAVSTGARLTALISLHSILAPFLRRRQSALVKAHQLAAARELLAPRPLQ